MSTPNRWCASITSRPLLIKVAESIVIRPPISQVGWASASSGVTSARSVRPRNGPARGRQDQPFHRSGRLAAQELEQRRVLGVHRQDSAPGRLGQGGHQLAADHEALLVGERQVDALAERDDRWPEPRGADDRVQHEVRLAGDDQLAHALHRPTAPASPRAPPSPWPPRSDRRARPRPRRSHAPAPRAAPSCGPPTAPRARARPSARSRRAPARRSSRSSLGSEPAWASDAG